MSEDYRNFVQLLAECSFPFEKQCCIETTVREKKDRKMFNVSKLEFNVLLYPL